MRKMKKSILLLLTVALCITNFSIRIHADDDEPVIEQTYTAGYEFVMDDGSDVPEYVMELLPEKRTDLKPGDVIVNDPVKDVETEESVFSFVSWNYDEFTIEDSDVTFIGTWTRSAKDFEQIKPDEKEPVETETYRVYFDFIRWNSLFDENLPDEVKALLPEAADVPIGEEPDLPMYDVTAGWQFRGWDKVQWTDDSKELHTVYFGLWDETVLRVIPGGNSSAYEGRVYVTTGDPLGVPGSGVPSFSLNGHAAYCVTPWISGYAVTGTSYYPQSMGYGNAGPMSERVANVLVTCERRGVDAATTQAAVWDALGYFYGVHWEDYYDSSIEAWGEVYETYTSETGEMQDLGYWTGYKEKGGYAKVKKVAASTSFDFVSNCPNNYSLKGAVYGVYSDSACTNLLERLTTKSDGNTNTSGSLEEGIYYVKEISPSPGFRVDTNVYSVKVVSGETATVTSTETPLYDPLTLILYKKDRRESKYVNHLDEARFTLKYYDAQTDSPSGRAKYTWVFRTKFNSQGQAVVVFSDPTYYVNGDPIDSLIDSSGRFFLPLGTFTIEETTAPQLYARDENVYVGHVYNNNGHASHEIRGGSVLIVENDDLSQSEELQTVKLIIQKVDAETGRPELPEDHVTNTASLEGGVFHIWRIGEYDTSGTPKIVEIDPVDYGTVTTDENGRAELVYEPGTADGLLPGRFRIVEEKAPNGYALNEKEFILEAPVQERNTAVFEYTLEIGDKLTRIQVEKLDQDGDLISGDATATIQLIETDTGKVVYEFVADGQPHIIRGLTAGVKYHLHEVYVSANYMIAIDRPVIPIDENDSELHNVNTDYDYSSYYHMVDHEVEIHTTATFSDEGKKEWDNPSSKHYVADGIAHIFDEVAYKNLYAGGDYVLVGELWDKTDNVSLENVVRKEFTPKYDVGIETLEFKQQLDDLDNHELVVFETLFRVVTNEDGSTDEIQVTEHRDLDDEDQTIYVDELYRADFEVVKVNADDIAEVLEGVTFNMKTYRVKRDGTVEENDLGEFTTDENGKIFIEKLKEDTKVIVTETEEMDPTWYRWPEPFIFDIGHNNTIELHSHQIENHQIRIGTTALFDESGTKNYVADGVAHIIDAVSYEWLYEGDEYALVAHLIDKGTEDNPTELEVKTVEHRFTAEEISGSEDVVIEFDFSDMDNHDFVVFEELFHIVPNDEGDYDEIKVAEHQDIDDKDQTVHVDELYRAAMILYKIGDGNKSIRLSGAYFNVKTSRTKRDGTVVEKDLGIWVTGGIFLERNEAFKAEIYFDEDCTELVKSVDSSYNKNISKQTVSVLDLKEGIYYVKVDGEDEMREFHVEKGMIYLPDQPEDTVVTYTEIVAPAGYYLDKKPFVQTVGHDYSLDEIENYRSNSLIIITNDIPHTGNDGQ